MENSQKQIYLENESKLTQSESIKRTLKNKAERKRVKQYFLIKKLKNENTNLLFKMRYHKFLEKS